jgi:hypothetical protein
LYRLLKWADTSNLVTPIIMDPIIADPMRALRMNSVTYYIRGGAQKGSDERDPDYIPEEEVWRCRSSYTIIIIVACSILNLLIQFVGS